MPITLRVTIPGYNALTETDQKKYSIYADADNVLIKELARGTLNGQSEEIAHNLGYLPHMYAYGEISSGRFQLMTGFNLFGDFKAYVDSSKLYLINSTGGDKDMRYFIFYDDIPE